MRCAIFVVKHDESCLNTVDYSMYPVPCKCPSERCKYDAVPGFNFCKEHSKHFAPTLSTGFDHLEKD